MRCLSMVIAATALVLSGGALAVPNADAEQAYGRGDYATAFKDSASVGAPDGRDKRRSGRLE